MTLNELNTLANDAAITWFAGTCTATRWCELMADQRPFESIAQLEKHAKSFWQQMGDEDVLEALAGHPMIGDISTLREKYASTKALASGEQSGMQAASDETLLRMQQLNKDYLAKHGFIFIICASGLSADAMLSEIESRLPNSSEEELNKAASEQIKITLLRINKALEEDEGNND